MTSERDLRGAARRLVTVALNEGWQLAGAPTQQRRGRLGRPTFKVGLRHPSSGCTLILEHTPRGNLFRHQTFNASRSAGLYWLQTEADVLLAIETRRASETAKARVLANR